MATDIPHLINGLTVWGWIIVLYLLAAFLTLLPTLTAVFGKVKLKPGGPSFEKAQFKPATKKRLSDHYERMQGTLAFWKREAARYGRFHYYSLWWTIISSSLMPFLTQAVDPKDPASKWLLTVISAHIVLALGFHRGLKVPELFRAFRLGESGFYDTYRRLLDQPETFGPDETTQVKRYFDDVEILRKLVRNAETDNQPTVEDIRNQFSKPREGV
jgi:hypothetical protein